MSYDADRLLSLLPALYRDHDWRERRNGSDPAELGTLGRLLAVVARQADLLERDVETLLDDHFIETCRPWVVPYIGELVGNDLLFDADRATVDDTALERFKDLTGPDLRPPVAARARADVAKTIYYRRRKGTPAMLEELARDVTGYAANAVEQFERVGWTQDLEHVRTHCGFADLRSPDRMDRVGGAFDDVTHVADLRPIDRGGDRERLPEGRHNVPNVAFFLWRLRSYPVERIPARAADAQGRFRFSPLGHDAPLFARRRREALETALAAELDVPHPIRHIRFCRDLVEYRDALPAPVGDEQPPRPDHSALYGTRRPTPSGERSPASAAEEEWLTSFAILVDGQPVPLAADPAALPYAYVPRVVARPLEPWPAYRPQGEVVHVDVERGRMLLGTGFGDAPEVLTSHHYGFAGDLGGGPYDRRKWLVAPDEPATPAAERTVRLLVRRGEADDVAAGRFGSLRAALGAWSDRARPDTVISIDDSELHELPATLELPAEGSLTLEAANEERPILRTPERQPTSVYVATPEAPVAVEPGAALTLSGVVVEGALRVARDLGRLRLLHATLVPGRSFGADGLPDGGPSVEVDPALGDRAGDRRIEIELAFSICGPIVAAARTRDDGIWLLDSILDGLGDDGAALAAIGADIAPALVAERSTVLGSVRCARLEASETIFTGRVDVERTQEGCVRFSYLPPDDGGERAQPSRTPRRYRCQPDHAVAEALRTAVDRDPTVPQAERDELRASVRRRLVPHFSARAYGRPGYGQLHAACPPEIVTGAEDGAEMGAFNHVKQPQRESNLRVRLGEYLPFGRQAGVIYES